MEAGRTTGNVSHLKISPAMSNLVWVLRNFNSSPGVRQATHQHSYTLQIESQIEHFTDLCLIAWPLNESEAGVDIVLIEIALLFLCKLLLISMKTRKGGFYQNMVNSCLTFIQRRGKMFYYHICLHKKINNLIIAKNDTL